MPEFVSYEQAFQKELLKAAQKHKGLSIPATFALPGVRDDIAQQPCPSIFLPDSEIMLCLVLSHLLGEQTTPTARCTALKRHLQMMQGDACIVEGTFVLTFSQKLHLARRHGFPIRFDQAWGTPRYIWFYLTEDMLALLVDFVQRCAEKDDMAGLAFQPTPDQRLWIDRYVEVTEAVAKRRTEQARRVSQIVLAAAVQSRKDSGATSYSNNGQVVLPLSHYDATVLQKADALAHKWMRLNPGPYQGNESCVKLIIILVRTVAVRQSWHAEQKRLYLEKIHRRIQMWAPELIQDGLANVYLTATRLGTTIQWSPNAKRINVRRLLAPIIDELRP